MAFRGWPAEALEFYEGLAADNSKAYWLDHKSLYDEKVLAPMVALLADLGPEFGGSRIFRPYRDVRFSTDKAPYKLSIAATFERGGYVTLSADGLGAGSGMYMMEAAQLARFRASVDDDRSGEDLRRIIAGIESEKARVTGHEVLKTVPRGFARDHPRGDLLRYKGIVAWQEWSPGPWLGRATARDRVVAFLRLAAPLKDWLATHVSPVDSP